MFKTSEQCLIELVARSVGMLDADDTSTYSGDLDFMPCSAARVSFGNEDKTGQDVGKDRKLMKYLADHKHMTPFEYQHATFLIECPLFIRSQIHRHRTFSYNEISRRYTDENLEFWIPDTWRGQSKSNRQASTEEVVAYDGFYIPGATTFSYKQMMELSLEMYYEMMQQGVAREQARAVLPQSLLTKFYMGGTLRNWAHFIELRRDEHAQKEVQIVAVRIADKLRELWPESCDALGI
jgi:thymidylate synthase (FAD)